MKQAFTMIELIFIIVIIGILAAVAIPKLAANTKDANAALIATELSLCIDDAVGAFMKTNKFVGIANGSANTLPQGSTACLDSHLTAKDGVLCYSISVTDNSGSIAISEVGVGSPICQYTHIISEENGISLAGGIKTLRF